MTPLKIVTFVLVAVFAASWTSAADLDRYAPTKIARARKSPATKMSAALHTEAGVQTFLVVFYEDVLRGDAELAVSRTGMKRIENPDLLPHHVVAEGSREQAEALAGVENVAYILPASSDLAAGQPVVGCLGPMATEGQVANYIATIGQGWDGAGQSAAELTYSFGRLTDKMPRSVVVSSVEQALAEWARHVQIRFTYTEKANTPRNLSFVFTTHEHGDPYPFDGPGRVLAHTFYPAPVNPEPIAGDVHFDDDEGWHNGGGVDFYSVLLHEIGHALGLGHSDRADAVMYPYYRRLDSLQTADVSALQRLYAIRTSQPEVDADQPAEPAPTPSSPEPPSTPTTPSTPSGTPSTPTPQEPAPTGNAGNGIDRVAPSMTITSPALTIWATGSATARIAGIARDNVAVAQVDWSASGGRAGVAQGTANWAIDEIPLRIGDNKITIRVTDQAGNFTSRTVTVVRR